MTVFVTYLDSIDGACLGAGFDTGFWVGLGVLSLTWNVAPSFLRAGGAFASLFAGAALFSSSLTGLNVAPNFFLGAGTVVYFCSSVVSLTGLKVVPNFFLAEGGPDGWLEGSGSGLTTKFGYFFSIAGA